MFYKIPAKGMDEIVKRAKEIRDGRLEDVLPLIYDLIDDVSCLDVHRPFSARMELGAYSGTILIDGKYTVNESDLRKLIAVAKEGGNVVCWNEALRYACAPVLEFGGIKEVVWGRTSLYGQFSKHYRVGPRWDEFVAVFEKLTVPKE